MEPKLKEKIEVHSFIEWANFNANKKQVLAHMLAKAYDILGYGGAMGGGKSHWLRREVLYWIMKFWEDYHLTVQGVIFCEDYPALQDRQIIKIVEEFPKWLGEYRSGDKVYGHCFKLKPNYGGGVLLLRNLADVDKYDSAEFAVIGIDQGEKNPVKVFNVLRRRNRWPGINNCKFFVTFNPGGEPWCVDFFVDRNFTDEEKEQEKFQFVLALPQDNPFLGESYWNKLRSMSPAEQKAFMDGDMHAFEEERDSDGFMKLLTPMEIRNAKVDQAVQIGTVVLGVDVGDGGDKSTIVKKTDTAYKVLFNKSMKDPLLFAGIVAKGIKATNAKFVIIDKIGVGAGCYYRLIELQRLGSIPEDVQIVGLAWGGAPTKKKEKLFVNIKAELIWEVRQSILGGRKTIANDAWSQLGNIKYKRIGGEDGPIYIMSKKEMRERQIPSPDVVDAAALSELPTIKNLVLRQKGAGRAFHDETADLW